MQNANLSGFTNLTGPSEPKVTANLDGAVSYVWPDPSTTKQTFAVQGFRQPDIDLSLSFLSNPTPPMNVVIHPITNFAPGLLVVHTDQPLGTTHDVVTTAPYQDEFDVCSDAKYIYITWCSTKNLSIGIIGSEIWATVVDINTMAVQPGFPMSMGQGERPTIACDPRYNRSGGATPTFEVAFLTGHTNPSSIMVAKWNGSLTIIPLVNQYIPVGCPAAQPYHYVTHARILVSSVLASSGLQPTTDAVYAIMDYDEPHAPIARGKGTGTLAIPDGLGLVEYKQVAAGVPANYVDGMLLTPELPVQPDTWVIAPQGWPILDRPIQAIANPYDEQDYPTAAFNQFHCLYQYDESARTAMLPLVIVRGDDNGSCGTTDERMVMNQVYPVPSPAQMLPDNPTSYVAAVNQMGIHVHWRTATNIHFYARDMNRQFDEDIDENTLVTDQCTVSDGTAHGGTVGATITSNVNRGTGNQMTIWTDPNYGFSTTNVFSGLYQPTDLTTLNPFVGQLNFAGNNVKLFVSAANTFSIAKVASMPFCYLNFLGTGQGVEVHGTWDYYGRNATHNTSFVQTDIATPFTDGTADRNGAGTISIQGWDIHAGCGCERGPGLLIVHGGADFFTGKNGILHVEGHPGWTAGSGEINVNDEPNIYPPTGGTANPLATGHLTLLGQTALSGTGAADPMGGYDGAMIGNILWNTSDPNNIQDSKQAIVTVDDGNTGYSETDPQFYATGGFLFQNSDNQGTSVLQFGHANRSMTSDASCLDCVFDVIDGCTVSAGQIFAIDPPDSWVIEIKNSDFEQIRGKCIFAEDDNSLSANSFYGGVLVDGNTFGEFAPNVDANDATTHILFEPLFPIYFKNFDEDALLGVPQVGEEYSPPTITNNSFTYGNTWKSAIDKSAGIMWANNNWSYGAIGLENTTGIVEGNTIKDAGFPAGISLVQSGYQPPLTYSVICDNDIENLNDDEDEAHFDGYGMIINMLDGTISWNTIENNDMGIEIFDKSHPRMEYNTITGNNEGSLEVQSGPDGASLPDMSGNPSLSLYADNTLSNEGQDITGNENDLETPILSLINGGTVNITDGHNNFIPTTPFSTNDSWVIYGQNTSRTPLGNVEGNYWGAGNAPSNDPTFFACWGTHFCTEFVSWDLTHLTTSAQSTLPTFTACEPLFNNQRAHKNTIQPLSEADSETCATLYNKVDNVYLRNHDWEPMYDTGKKFIEMCANYENGQGDFNSVFGDIGGGMMALAPQDTSIFIETRKWLESVLYLNTTDPNYFCLCVNYIGGTFRSVSDTTETLTWKSENCGLAIERWLWENDPQCDTQDMKRNYNATRFSQREDWLNDTNVLYDTTLPSMAQLGLDTILSKHLLMSVSKPPQGFITNVSASPNPVTTGTVISFGIRKEAYVKIEVFDILGNRVSSAGFESLFEPGNKAVPISLQGLPSGTYFARILTAYGEVQTVKLVKE